MPTVTSVRDAQRDKRLDFLIIGAQKAGTTALHKYLEQHPQIHVPPEKEAPFFSHDERYGRGIESFMAEFYGTARGECKLGKVTPSYLGDPRVPRRIAECLPEVRLVALLRDPIARAMSHYEMCVRRGQEARPFDEAVMQQLEEASLLRARELPPGWANESSCYVVWGEYGRLLGNYLREFPREQLLLLFTETMERDPAGTYARVCAFLGVDASFRPSNLGQRYHDGGRERRVDWLETTRKIGVARDLWRLIPHRYRRRMHYWYEQWNVKPGGHAPVCARTERLLATHFRPDQHAVAELCGERVPWHERLHEADALRGS